jgi:small subunit ribosomal protein S17
MKKETEKKENKKEVKAKILSGVVVSDKMDKTIVVSVSRFVKHPKYGKYYKINKNYKADDREGKYKEGDKVKIKEVKPISKGKKFIVID